MLFKKKCRRCNGEGTLIDPRRPVAIKCTKCNGKGKRWVWK